MTDNERTSIMNTVDALRTIGGANGFSNLRPRVKRQLLIYAGELEAIVKRDQRGIMEGSDLDRKEIRNG